MIDHLLTFQTEAAAQKALEPLGYWVKDTHGGGGWDRSRVVPGIKLVLQDAVIDVTDPANPVVVSPKVVAPGWHIAVAEPQVSAALCALPGNACRVVTDRSKARPGRRFWRFAVSTDTMPEGLAADFDAKLVRRNRAGKVQKIVAKVSPIWAGSDYPF